MKKASAKKNNTDLRPEYDLSKLTDGERGKYYRKATAGTNLVLIEPELTEVFPDTESVNRVLRLLAELRHRRPDEPILEGVNESSVALNEWNAKAAQKCSIRGNQKSRPRSKPILGQGLKTKDWSTPLFAIC